METAYPDAVGHLRLRDTGIVGHRPGESTPARVSKALAHPRHPTLTDNAFVADGATGAGWAKATSPAPPAP